MNRAFSAQETSTVLFHVFAPHQKKSDWFAGLSLRSKLLISKKKGPANQLKTLLFVVVGRRGVSAGGCEGERFGSVQG